MDGPVCHDLHLALNQALVAPPCLPPSSADDLRFLFSSESLTEAEDTDSRAAERSAFILALVIIVGIPPDKNYFHMAAFEPAMLDSQNGQRSQGLGSGYRCAVWAGIRL